MGLLFEITQNCVPSATRPLKKKHSCQKCFPITAGPTPACSALSSMLSDYRHGVVMHGRGFVARHLGECIRVHGLHAGGATYRTNVISYLNQGTLRIHATHLGLSDSVVLFQGHLKTHLFKAAFSDYL